MADNTLEKKAVSPDFFKGVSVEFKKVSWPNRKTLVKQTTAVVAVSVALGVIIALLDMAIQYGLSFITV